MFPWAPAQRPTSPAMASTFTAEAYRSEAQRLRDVADTAASEAIRAELLDLAQHYEELADLAEADNRGD